jgi:hypothetical protein
MTYTEQCIAEAKRRYDACRPASHDDFMRLLAEALATPAWEPLDPDLVLAREIARDCAVNPEWSTSRCEVFFEEREEIVLRAVRAGRAAERAKGGE